MSKRSSRAWYVGGEEQWDDSGYRIVDEDGEEQHQRLGWGDLRGTETQVELMRHTYHLFHY